MVLPGTWSAALFLIIISAICFGVWPGLYKLSGAKWRFELFAFDFGAGSLLIALIAAYTLGTMGSSLDFSDNMLVSGRRIELLAFLTGGAFALANLFFLGSISLLGLANATLLTVSVFGCALGLMNLDPGLYLTSGSGAVIFLVAAGFTIASIQTRRAVAMSQTATVGVAEPGPQLAQRAAGPAASAPKPPGYYARPSGHAKKPAKPPMSLRSKGVITGVLGGLVFSGVVPLLSLIQPPMLSIGAYGGMLLGTSGIFFFTFFLNFFFLNVSLEGGNIGYSAYFAGTLRNHLMGLLTGTVWCAGALALYTASTGTAGVTWFDSWVPVFAGAVLSALIGLMFWQTGRQSSGSRIKSVIALVLFLGGVAVMLAGFRK